MKKFLCLPFLMVAWSVFGQQPILRNPWSTNVAGTPVIGNTNLSVTNLGSGLHWEFYSNGPSAVARLSDATNAAVQAALDSTNLAGGSFVRRTDLNTNQFGTNATSVALKIGVLATNLVVRPSTPMNHVLSLQSVPGANQADHFLTVYDENTNVMSGIDGEARFFGDGSLLTNLAVPYVSWASNSIAIISRGSSNYTYTSFTNAFAALQSGDVLTLRPGNYTNHSVMISNATGTVYPELRMVSVDDVTVDAYGVTVNFTNYGATLLVRGCSDCKIRGIKFVGPSASYTNMYSDSTNVIYPDGLGQAVALVQAGGGVSQRLKFYECTFENVPDQAISCFQDTESSPVTKMRVESCVFYNVGTTNGPAWNPMDGGCITGDIQDGTEVINCWAGGNIVYFYEHELTIESGLDVPRHGGTIRGNWAEGVWLNAVICSARAGTTSPITGFECEENFFIGNPNTLKFGTNWIGQPRGGIAMVSAKIEHGRIFANTIVDFSNPDYASARDNAIRVTTTASGAYASNLVITANSIQDCDGGIWVEDSTFSGGGKVVGLNISGGNVLDRAGDAIRVTGTDVNISDNIIRNWGTLDQRWGILIEGESVGGQKTTGFEYRTNGVARNFRIANNLMHGLGNNSYYPIFIAGTCSNMVIRGNDWYNYTAGIEPVFAESWASNNITFGATWDNYYIRNTNGMSYSSLRFFNPNVGASGAAFDLTNRAVGGFNPELVLWNRVLNRAAWQFTEAGNTLVQDGLYLYGAFLNYATTNFFDSIVVMSGSSNWIGGKVVMTNLSLTGVSGTTTFLDPVRFDSNATMAANATLSLSNAAASQFLVTDSYQRVTNTLDGSSLTNLTGTNINFSYATWAGPTNAVALINDYKLYSSWVPCDITNVTGGAANQFRWVSLCVSNASASNINLLITAAGRRPIGVGTTNSTVIYPGKVGVMSIGCFGTLITNYAFAAEQ